MVSYYNSSVSEGRGRVWGGGGGGWGSNKINWWKTITICVLGHYLMIIELERYFSQNVQFDPFLRLGTEE